MSATPLSPNRCTSRSRFIWPRGPVPLPVPPPQRRAAAASSSPWVPAPPGPLWRSSWRRRSRIEISLRRDLQGQGSAGGGLIGGGGTGAQLLKSLLRDLYLAEKRPERGGRHQKDGGKDSIRGTSGAAPAVSSPGWRSHSGGICKERVVKGGGAHQRGGGYRGFTRGGYRRRVQLHLPPDPSPCLLCSRPPSQLRPQYSHLVCHQTALLLRAEGAGLCTTHEVRGRCPGDFKLALQLRGMTLRNQNTALARGGEQEGGGWG